MQFANSTKWMLLSHSSLRQRSDSISSSKYQRLGICEFPSKRHFDITNERFIPKALKAKMAVMDIESGHGNTNVSGRRGGYGGGPFARLMRPGTHPQIKPQLLRFYRSECLFHRDKDNILISMAVKGMQHSIQKLPTFLLLFSCGASMDTTVISKHNSTGAPGVGSICTSCKTYLCRQTMTFTTKKFRKSRNQSMALVVHNNPKI